MLITGTLRSKRRYRRISSSPLRKSFGAISASTAIKETIGTRGSLQSRADKRTIPSKYSFRAGGSVRLNVRARDIRGGNEFVSHIVPEERAPLVHTYLGSRRVDPFSSFQVGRFAAADRDLVTQLDPHTADSFELFVRREVSGEKRRRRGRREAREEKKYFRSVRYVNWFSTGCRVPPED